MTNEIKIVTLIEAFIEAMMIVGMTATLDAMPLASVARVGHRLGIPATSHSHEAGEN